MPLNEGEYKKGANWIQVAGGNKFYLHNPMFTIEMIAHSLAQTNRYNGHGNFPYSVAQHSILVSEIMSQLYLGDPLEGMLHDATEAFLGDMAGPWKSELPDFCRLEDKLDLQIRSHFQIVQHKTKGCKEADWIALWIESKELFIPEGTNDWYFPMGIEHAAREFVRNQDAFFKIREVKWEAAKDHFIWRYRRLIGRSTHGIPTP